MTTEEFYARALLAPLPIADAATKTSQSTTSSLAHDYAAALTTDYHLDHGSGWINASHYVSTSLFRIVLEPRLF